MEAIVNAGDITITGDRKAVTVMRKTPTGVVMQDRPYRYQCNEIPFIICSPMIIFT
jgi:hypothetical protein